MQGKHHVTKLIKLLVFPFLSNQEESLRIGTSRFNHPFSRKWKPCHGAINNRSCRLRIGLNYFRFHSNCKQIRIEAANTLSQFEICFPLFSETTHTILKRFSQQCSSEVQVVITAKKVGCQIFWPKFFCQVASAPLRISSVNMTKSTGKCGFGQTY